ncbi:TRAP transporter small permease [Neomoorella humiferrea]|uniref:TRAP transporter small permease n=1 Tax=Neomoorella humiferrea TaxID=676965 RepID=UPI003D8F98AD
MKGIRRIVEILDSIELKISMLLTLMVFAVVILAVMFRYIVRSPLSWSDMIARYMLIWIVGLGVLPAYRRRSHIGVDMVIRLLPARAKRVVEIIAVLCQIGFYLVLAVFGCKYTIFAASMRSEIWGISLGWIYVTVAILSIGSLIYLVCMELVKTPGNDTKDNNLGMPID